MWTFLLAGDSGLGLSHCERLTLIARSNSGWFHNNIFVTKQASIISSKSLLIVALLCMYLNYFILFLVNIYDLKDNIRIYEETRRADGAELNGQVNLFI